GKDEILDGGQVGLIGLGSPLVLGALLGQPAHQELAYRHRGWNQKCSACQFVLDLLFAVYRLLFGGKALPFVAAFAVFILIGIADAVGAAAFCDICHGCLLVKLPGTAMRENCLWGYGYFRRPAARGSRWSYYRGYRRSAG